MVSYLFCTKLQSLIIVRLVGYVVVCFKQIISFLCYKDPCVAVLEGHTDYVLSVAKLNETTIISGSRDNTVRVWDLNIARENKIKRAKRQQTKNN